MPIGAWGQMVLRFPILGSKRLAAGAEILLCLQRAGLPPRAIFWVYDRAKLKFAIAVLTFAQRHEREATETSRAIRALIKSYLDAPDDIWIWHDEDVIGRALARFANLGDTARKPDIFLIGSFITRPCWIFSAKNFAGNGAKGLSKWWLDRSEYLTTNL